MVNDVTLVGRCGADPEVRFLNDGTATCRVSLATSEKWKDRDGAGQERTTWHEVTAFGKLAETIGQYVNKGKLLYVRGSIRIRDYDDKDGNKRKAYEINAREVKFLGGRGDESSDRKPEGRLVPAQDQRLPNQLPPGEDDDGGDIPF